MRVVIAGSRTFYYMYRLEESIKKSGLDITEVVCGMARGVDELGYRWAREHDIPIKEFPADWNRYGKAAGPIRNKEMAEYSDAAIVLMYPDSRGSANMVLCMHELNKPSFVVYLSDE